MNKVRREKLKDIITRMSELNRALSDVIADEELALESIPENLQGTDRYQVTEDSLDLMYDAQSSISDAIDAVDDVLSL